MTGRLVLGTLLVLALASGAQAQTSQSAGEAPIIVAQSTRSRQPSASDTLETRFWNSIRSGNSAADFRTYLDAYPDGKFAAQARQRLQQIEGAARPAPNPPRPAVTVQPAPPAKPVEPVQPTASPASPRATPDVQAVRDCPQCPQLVLIPAGGFSMGATEMFPFEQPVHHVTIRRPFYIGQTEVTYDEWDACVAEGGCSFRPDDRGAGRGRRAVANINWTDAQQYVGWLSKKTGKKYRLPTESEWEYAARGGTTSTYWWGKAMEKGYANCSGCNGGPSGNVIDVGTYPPNPYGLFDMAGNAAEWVEDCWTDSYRSAPVDGTALEQARCQERVLRGGSFNNDPRYLRSAARFKYDFDVRFYANGMRVARDQ